MRKTLSVGLGILALSACSLAPKYVTPPMPIPANYKETGHWVTLDKSPKMIKRAWWQAFHDPKLDALEEQLTVANQDLRIAYTHYQHSRA